MHAFVLYHCLKIFNDYFHFQCLLSFSCITKWKQDLVQFSIVILVDHQVQTSRYISTPADRPNPNVDVAFCNVMLAVYNKHWLQ